MTRANYIKTFFSILTIAILIAISYSNAINAPFQFDDYPNIVDNHFTKIRSLQITELAQAATNGKSSHRWLPNLSFAIQYYFSALNTPAYHFFNITVHFLCATILYFLILTTLEYAGTDADNIRKHEIAFVTAILWSLHPVQTNAVTYIVQRMTSMSALFYLSAIFLYAQGRLPNQPVLRKYQIYSAGIISILLAITSKENAAMLPLMIIAYEYFIISPDSSFKHQRRTFFAIGCAILLLLILGWLWIGRHTIDLILQGYQGRYFSISERLMTEPRVIFYYLDLLIYPVLSHLSIDHDILISTTLFSPPTTILALGGLLLLIYSIIYLFNKNRILSFAILWFLLNLVIESSIIPLELCFEHRLYLPSTILIFALVLLMYRSADRRIPLLRMGIIIVTIGLGLLTWNRNVVWQSSASLWSDALAKSPNAIRPYANLGNALVNKKDYPQAEAYLLKALEVDAHRKVDRTHQAWKHEMSAIHADLASVYQLQKDFARATYHAEEALRLEPTSEYALLAKGILLVQERHFKAADEIFTLLAANGIDTVDLYKNWGVCAINNGDADRAIFMFRHALGLDPDNSEVHYYLGLSYGDKGMLEEARREMLLGMRQSNQP